MHRPEFSFVIPAYNCGEYLSEAIDSILSQENYNVLADAQIIIVNDGSTDDTALICESYAKEFPDNIIYIEQKNAGASAARLAGFEKATGAYINFLDADDKWSLDACACFHNFFQKHPEVALCAAKHIFFGAKNHEHALGYKFACDAVVDLNSTYDFPQLSLNNLFVKREVFKPEYADNRLLGGEDFLCVDRILMDVMQYGVLHQPTYWYRKRGDASSALDRSQYRLSWYTEQLVFCDKALFADSLERFGTVLPFLQYAIMYDLQWRIKSPIAIALTEKQRKEYRNLVVDLLQYISDTFIIEQRNINLAEKLYALSVKYGFKFEDLQNSLTVIGKSIYIMHAKISGQLCLSSLEDQNLIFIDFITRNDDTLQIEGRLNTLFPIDKIQVVAQGTSWTAEACVSRRESRKYDGIFDSDYFCDKEFTICIPCCPEARGLVQFELLFDGHVVEPVMRFGQFSPLTSKRFDFAVLDDCTLTKYNSNTLDLKQTNKPFLAKREALFESYAWLSNDNLRKTKNLKYRRYAFNHTMLPRHEKEEIWLFMDRPTMAGDNAEALFCYLQEHPLPGVKPYFLLNADSPDFKRMSQYGPVVEFDSSEHIKLQIRASKIISAAGDKFTYNRLQKDNYLLQGLQSYQYIFLQHGITQNDISGWINRYNKDISLFVTSSPYEWRSIVENPAYGYDSEQVVLTGFPRHDRLLAAAEERAKKNIILIAPTWRKDIVGKTNIHTGKREENPGFQTSDYYRFYQGLLNDERLLKLAKALGYDIHFLIHPALMQEAHKFTSPLAKILTEYRYTDELADSAIMVTDFSSVVFDFALLKKPILYSQFDEDTFYTAHMWDPGYFSYRENGFGDVVNTFDDTVSNLCALMESPAMPEKYQKRVDDFFYWPKTSRCEELIAKILAL